MGEGVLELWIPSKFGVFPVAREEVGDFRKQSFFSRCFTFSHSELGQGLDFLHGLLHGLQPLNKLLPQLGN